MTREERDLTGLVVAGSDHLTAYNVYADAYTQCGYVGEVYGLARHLFDERIEEWAERRGVLVKALEDAALALASVYRSVGSPLPTSDAAGDRPGPPRVRRAGGAVHAARSRHRRGDGRWRARARVPVECVRELGRDRRHAAAISPIGGAFRARRSRGRRSRSDMIRKFATAGAPGRSSTIPAPAADPVRDRVPIRIQRVRAGARARASDVAPPREEADRLKREYTTKRDTSRKSRGRGARRRENPPRGSRGPGTPRGRGGRGPGKRRGR